MTVRGPLPAHARLLALFVLSSSVVLAAIGWLAWRLLAQERTLDDQRVREQLNGAATFAVRELDLALGAWEERLSTLAAGSDISLPAESAAIVFDERGVVRRAGVLLPFVPLLTPPTEAPARIFAEAEAREFERNDLDDAARRYRRLAISPDETVRASALMRLARVLRRQHRLEQAIETYRQLEDMGPSIWVAASPAALVAAREQIELFGQLRKPELAKQQAHVLAEQLSSGRHLIDRTEFEFYREVAEPLAPSAALGLAEQVSTLWAVMNRQENGRWAQAEGEFSTVAVWRRTPNGSALIIGKTASLVPTLSALNLSGFVVALADAGDRQAWGTIGKGPSIVRNGRETGLPWTVRVTAVSNNDAESVIRSRRLLVIAGFVLAALVITSAGVAMFRAVSYELNVARLQSEFVATVSHEFRTPLTAMRHLAEMLDEGLASQDRVPHYYRALVRETRRLQSLVESLLDFGRMEAGRRTYRMEHVDAAVVVREVVESFPDAPSAQRIHLRPSADADISIHVDREAVALALRNLIDNALKYSPDTAAVSVSLTRDERHAVLSVTDAGPGIALSEQREVFRKFVRGDAAAARHVKGTGLGLAIAQHIVTAHGGELHLKSEVGRGSTFSIVLPLAPIQRAAALIAVLEHDA